MGAFMEKKEMESSSLKFQFRFILYIAVQFYF